MHLAMYLPPVEPKARLTIHAKLSNGEWTEDIYEAPTLEEVAQNAGQDFGPMNAAYERLVALGVPEVRLSAYTREGNDANDADAAKRWTAFFRHPQNSGMTMHGKGNSAGAAIEAAVREETARQRAGIQSRMRWLRNELRLLDESLAELEG